ncbi:MAG: AMP-binding protein [Aquamicrobium sp.]|uniref:acyl-CoA synthetase n=1 Tax=Mesorhizobium sp. Pch-S TaxID=2082387 RepID=UPI001010120C|nr:AMP-binding protein [Mesorhizobium sp. Pch-S]MBR2688265.1 AMP-binding protein [Aquamicrobium sp.]QAZ47270.1 acyl-CoA synthetase [Mesorhizobium sp. Pch-S]
MDFSTVDRTYARARAGFRLEIPEHFNFAFDVIDDWSKRDDRTAVIAVSRDGETIQRIAYSQLSESSNRFANALRKLGVKAGDFACLVIGRVPAWYTVLFGCMKAGVVSMPGTNLLTAHDIAYRVNHSKATAVIVTSEHCAKVDAIRAECPTLTTFIVIDGERDSWLSFDRLLAEASPELDRKDFPPSRATDMMMAYFTSGTTSLPKMVPRDHGYALAHVATGLFWMDLRPGDVHWSLTDTGWAKAAWGILFPQLMLGTPAVLYNGDGAFDADMHLKLIGKLRVSTFCAPPTVYRLFAQQDLKRYDLSSLRRSLGAGEPLNPEVMRIWKEATGTTIADGYGQTETINIVANFPGEEVRFGSMGKPVPGYDVDVVDDDGKRLPDEEVGHIAVRVTDPHPGGLFHGYYTGKALDTGSFRNGWYYTGDTARRDKDGYLWFVGRSDDLISSAGYRISPFEVESALIEHKAVAESAVIGKPDPTRGQIVKAYVILAKGFTASEDLARDIQEFCRNLTAPYKYPREIEFVDALPKTISGKIRRVELRQASKG